MSYGEFNLSCHNLFFSVQKPNSGLRGLVVQVYTLHTHTPDGLLWMSDQLVVETATYPTCNQHKRRTSMMSVGFEYAISGIKRPHDHRDWLTPSRIYC